MPLPPETLAKTEDAAVAAAAKIGGPVALKVQSPNILHKTEAGAVMLNVSGDAAVGEAYRTVLERAKAAHPEAHIEGVLVQAMARRGVEMIIGITSDPDFGPMLMVGLGGIHVEVLKDVAFAPVPLGPDEALDLVGQLKGAALLDGVRGAPPSDKAALAQLISTLSRFAARPCRRGRRNRPEPGHRPPRRRRPDGGRCADRKTLISPCHYEQSEAISRRWSLLRPGLPRRPRRLAMTIVSFPVIAQRSNLGPTKAPPRRDCGSVSQ